MPAKIEGGDMTERISALMDGELDRVAAGSEVQSLRKDSELREVWNTYHLIGDVMRGDLISAYDQRVTQCIAKEPVVLAPGRLKEIPPLRFVRYALSAAASLAAVWLVLWTAAPTRGMPEMVATQNKAPRVIATQPVGIAGDVENYLLAHQRYSPSNAMQGVAPYVRLVSEGQEGATR